MNSGLVIMAVPGDSPKYGDHEFLFVPSIDGTQTVTQHIVYLIGARVARVGDFEIPKLFHPQRFARLNIHVPEPSQIDDRTEISLRLPRNSIILIPP